jgi:hypothetical protein
MVIRRQRRTQVQRLGAIGRMSHDRAAVMTREFAIGEA